MILSSFLFIASSPSDVRNNRYHLHASPNQGVIMEKEKFRTGRTDRGTVGRNPMMMMMAAALAASVSLRGNLRNCFFSSYTKKKKRAIDRSIDRSIVDGAAIPPSKRGKRGRRPLTEQHARSDQSRSSRMRGPSLYTYLAFCTLLLTCSRKLFLLSGKGPDLLRLLYFRFKEAKAEAAAAACQEPLVIFDVVFEGRGPLLSNKTYTNGVYRAPRKGKSKEE